MPLKELQEVLLLLAGYESEIYVLSPGGHDLELEQRVPGIDEPERVLLNRFAHLAYVHKCIRRDLAEVRARRGSLLVLAVVVAIEQQLRTFVSLVIDSENRILQKDAELVLGNTVGLTKLYAAFIPSAKVLDHLQGVAAQLARVSDKQRRTSPSRLVESLQAGVLTGYKGLQRIASDLLAAAEGVYQKSIESWCLYGTLYSEYENDFFVQSDLQSPGNYIFVPEHCPHYIEYEVAQLIFDVGLLVAQLHKEVPLYTYASEEAEHLQKHVKILATIRSPLTSEVIFSAVTSLNRSLSAHLLTKILPMTHTIDLLHLLRSYYLVENGYFALELIERAENDFRTTRRDMGHLKNSVVQAVLAQTISKTSQSHEAEDEMAVIDGTSLSMKVLREEDLKDDISLFPFLLGVPIEMKLDLQWPLTILITEVDIKIYATIFNYLISIKRSEHLLHNLWRGRRQEIQISRIARATWSTAFRALFFLQSLSEYYHASVIKNFSTQLDSILIIDTETYSPSSIAVAHRRLLHELRRKIMIGPEFASTMHKLMYRIDLMLSSVRQQRQIEVTAQSATILDLIKRAVAVLTTMPDMDSLLYRLLNETSDG